MTGGGCFPGFSVIEVSSSYVEVLVMGEFEVPEFSGVEFGRVACSGPVVPSRGRPMTLERLRAMGSPQVLRGGVWVRLPYRATAMHVERWPELVAVLEAEQVLPFRPSVGTPAGWSEVSAPEL